MSTLKLQILLGAVDKLTAPLKAVTGQSRITAKELASAKNKVRELEKQADQIEGYRNLGKQIGVTRAKLNKAQDAAQKMARELAETTKPTREMTKELEKARNQVRQLSDAETHLVVRYGEAKAAIKAAGINTKQLGQHQRRLAGEITSANTALEQQQSKLAKVGEQQRKLAAVKANYRQTQELRDQIAGHGTAAVATGVAVGLPVLSVVKSYSQFEDAMSGVAKQVEGARTETGELTAVYYDMAKQIKAISEEMPTANGAIDIAALVEGAARMGVQGQENLLTFAKTAAKAATAFELPAAELAENMGKIANLYKIPISNIEQLGDAINFLDDNAQSKGGDIINVLQRMGGVADKLDFKKAAALGSTFLSLGSAPEVAANAANAMVRELSIATMQSDTFAAGLDTLGLNDKALQKAMTQDAMGTIAAVLEKINKLKPEDQMTVTTQLFGKEYGDDAGKLANNMGELYRQLKLVNAEKSKGSMQRESDIGKDSVSAQWMLLQAGIGNLQSSLGERLRAPLMDIIGYIQQTVGVIRRWVDANPELASTLVKVAAVTSVIAIALGGLALTVAALLGPLAVMRLMIGGVGVKLNLTSKGLSMLSRVMALNGSMAAPLLAKWAALGNAIKGLSFAKIGAGMKAMLTAITSMPTKIGALTAATWRYVTAQWAASKATAATKFTSMISGIRAATAATSAYVAANGVMGTSMNLLKGAASGAISLLKGGLVGALRLVGQTIAVVGRLLLMNPIGLLVTAIGLAALTIYRYWEPIKAFFSGFFQGIKEGLGPVAAVFTPAFEAMAGALSPLKPIWDGISSALGTAWEWVTNLLTPIKTTQQELDGATNAGKRFGLWLGGLGKSFIDVIADFTKFGADLIDGLLKGISDKWAELKTKIAAMTDLLPDWWNGGSEVKASVEHASTAPAVQAGKEGGFAGFYDKGGLIPAGKWGIAGEHGPEVVKGPASIISRRHTAAMASAAMLASMPLAAMQPHQDATRTIREQVMPAELRQPVEAARTIREQVVPAELRQPADTARTIREQVVPAVLRQPSDAIRSSPRIIDTPKLAPARGGGSTQIHAPISIVQQPGQSGADVAQEVRRELDRRERQASAHTRASLRDNS